MNGNKKKKLKPYKTVERIDVFIWETFVGAVALELTLIIVFVPLLSRVEMYILAPVIAVGCFVFAFA